MYSPASAAGSRKVIHAVRVAAVVIGSVRLVLDWVSVTRWP